MRKRSGCGSLLRGYVRTECADGTEQRYRRGLAAAQDPRTGTNWRLYNRKEKGAYLWKPDA
jgi:hypothetical protein